MRRIFALLAVASLSGCITDGPNKTGSEWLNSLDLGPQGYETVTLPLGVAEIDTIVEPGVPAYSGIGSLVVGSSAAFDATASIWFDAKDTTRWVSGGDSDVVDGWTLRVLLDTSCPSGKLHLSRWNTELDTGAFLLGADLASEPDYEASASCVDDTADASLHYIDFPLGDSSAVVRKGGNFGVRLDGEGFEVRSIALAAILNPEGDTLRYGLFEGRGAWGTRLVRKPGGSITGMLAAGTRLRMRLRADDLRTELLDRMGIDSVASDSFDNSVTVFSARVASTVANVSAGASQRLRLASWSILSRDTTDLEFSEGGSRSRAFSSSRARDGKTMSGELRLVGMDDGLVRVALVTDGDSIPFYTTEGTVVYHFYLFPGESIEAPMYSDPGWTKFRFENDGRRVRFVRAILSDAVAADDQIMDVDENGDIVYREEAIASAGVGKVRFEARTAFGRMLNNRKQEVWTDLYAATVSDASLEGNFRIDLAAKPVDSVSFVVRRRSLGVVE